MKIYNYHRITKELLSEGIATPNPLEDGNFLVPASATALSPLDTKDGFAICFNSTAWEYIEDNRGEEVYDSENNTTIVDYLGAIQDGFSLTENIVAPIPATESDIKIAVQSHIDEKARELSFDDINSIAKYCGFTNPYQADAEALRAWTVSVWVYIEAELTKVVEGLRTLPTIEDAILELPMYGA